MTSHRERDDDYARIVTNIDQNFRVIICKDQIQWILQKRDGKSATQARWTGVSFCTIRDALIRIIRHRCGEPQPFVMHCLNSLGPKIELMADD